jgi:hypothetical protein
MCYFYDLQTIPTRELLTCAALCACRFTREWNSFSTSRMESHFQNELLHLAIAKRRGMACGKFLSAKLHMPNRSS